MKAATAGEYLRPRTVMRLMVRLTAGSTKGAPNTVRMGDRKFRHEREADIRHHHGLHPILALGTEARVKLDPHVFAHAHDHLAHFARQAVDVRLA